MSKAVNVFFLLLTSVLFICSTLEVDVANYDNTFFDTYDTYIHTDVSYSQAAAPVLFDVPEFISSINTATAPQGSFVDVILERHNSPPLYLTHSVWRI